MNRKQFAPLNANTTRQRQRRRGSVMGLMAILLPVLAILAAFCINLAQMQLTRTELIVASDAAARAGGRAFSEAQTVEAAKTAAVTTAALNTVAGAPLQLSISDGDNELEFGITDQPDGDTGRYYFQKIPTSSVESGLEIASAFRVHGRRDSGSISGKVQLAIPGLLDQDDFETTQHSVAMQVDRDISLVLDRSGSMDWHPGFDWPPGIDPFTTAAQDAGVDAGKLRIRTNRWGRESYRPAGGESWESYQEWAWEEYFGLGAPPRRPWDELVLAVEAFIDVLDLTSQEEQVSVASYSTYATLDTYLEKDHEVVEAEVNGLDVGGSTGIGRGMQEGITALVHASARPFAAKTMVVMTDGNHNAGVDPDDVAAELMGAYNLTIHTVTFGEGADQDLMADVAAIGGGKHYHAANGDELVSIFEEIANNLPTIVTK